MPNSPSAKKRLVQSQKQRLRNRKVKGDIRDQIKKLNETVAAGNAQGAKGELTASFKTLDQAAAKGVIHPNKAARTKSRLNRRVKAISK
jgi:small subunit ribosomal protein S20